MNLSDGNFRCNDVIIVVNQKELVAFEAKCAFKSALKTPLVHQVFGTLLAGPFLCGPVVPRLTVLADIVNAVVSVLFDLVIAVPEGLLALGLVEVGDVVVDTLGASVRV